MSKKILLLALIALACAPATTFAAFSFTSQSGGDNGFKIFSQPNYWEEAQPRQSGGTWISGVTSPDPQTACTQAAGRSGLPDSQNTYCAYDYASYQVCGGGFNPPGNFCTSQVAVYVSVYQSAVEQVSLSWLKTQLQNYKNALFAYQYGGGPQPSHPGYYDICPIHDRTDIDWQPGVNPAWQNVSTTCSVFRHIGVQPAPVASLSANPTTVVAGNSSALTYSCTNSTSASISGVGAVTAPSGTVSVAPGATTAYTLTCTGAGGSATATATVTVIPALTGSCSVSPTSITAGQSATWTATASGGTGAYTYGWSGTDGLSGSASSVVGTYGTAGTKTASVTISSGSQTITQPCSNSLTVSPAPQPDLTAGAVAPASATVGTPVTFSAPASNVGNATSGSFPMLFQISENGALFNSAYTGALAPGGSVSMSAPYTFSAAGTYNVRACANYNTGWAGITPESSFGNNCGPWTVVTVTSLASDLTAGNVSGGPATAGTPVTLSATISNIGNAGTGAGFTNLFQRATDSSGTNATDIGTAANAVLGNGSSNSTSLSYTFPSSGTWYIRACADKSSAGNSGVIAESNEGNNCSGAWTVISVSAAPPTVTLACTVSNSNPAVGQNVTYTVTNGAGPFTWTPSDGVGSYGNGSTANRTFSSTGQYGMQVSASGYLAGNCPVVTAGSAACLNPSATISANPTRVRSGDTTTLTWSATGVDTSCVVSGPPGSLTVTPTSCNVGPTNYVTPPVTQQSVFKISCDNGESSAQVIVNLIPKFIEF